MAHSFIHSWGHRKRIFQKWELRNIHDLLIWNPGPHSSTKIFITIAAQRSPRRGQEVDHVGVREASSSVTIHEFNSQFGRNPQANPIRFWTIRRPRNAEIDYIRSETSPFRFEGQEPSTGRRHSIQGSIVRTLYSSNPNSSTPFSIWATMMLNLIDATEVNHCLGSIASPLSES